MGIICQTQAISFFMPDAALNFEIKRKLFHLCSIVFPIIYIFTTKITMGMALAIIAGLTLYLDISRHYNSKIKGVVDKFLGNLLRRQEQSGNFRLSGASYMALGLFLSCLLFPRNLTITSWLVLIVADSVASIMGMRFGTPLFNEKSYIGAVSFFVSAIFVSILSYFAIGYSTSFIIIIISSFLTTLVEFFAKQININDNLSIPITYALSTVVLGLLL